VSDAELGVFLMTYEHIILEKMDNFAKITINRPEKLNACAGKTRKEIITALDEVKADKKMRSVIITGAGKAFSAGQDLEEQGPQAAGSTWSDVYAGIKGFPLPVITSTPGFTVGAGWQSYLMGDYRLASENATFSMPELNVGLPCVTGSAILKAMIGLGETTRLILTCEKISANEAKRLGLVHEIVPPAELEKATVAAAMKLAEKPPNAIKLQKEWFMKLISEDLERARIAAEAAQAKARASGEPQECMTAFLEKRKPKLERT